MFSDNKKKRYAILLGLGSDDLLISEFIKRYTSYLKSKNEISKNMVLNGFFILDEIIIEIEKKKALELKYGSKNVYIIKYRDEIIKLYKNGFGYVRISNQLYTNHKVKVSKSTIERFIKSNKIVRG